MTKNNAALMALLCSLLALPACHSRQFQVLPDGINSVNINGSVDEWTVTVRNEHGSASDEMFRANHHQRSNIYVTSTNQLVVIEQGGGDVFFKLARHAVPEPLTGERYKERDVQSDDWRYIGVIRDGAFVSPKQEPECIALLGAGSSPYRKKHQAPSFC